MARAILSVSVIVLLGLVGGCADVDEGQSRIVAIETVPSEPAPDISGAGETELVEQMSVSRQSYSLNLETLVQYYRSTGNNMKLEWAQKELSSLNSIPRYNYIVEAAVAGPDLKASVSIAEADLLYGEGVALENKAEQFVVIKSNKLLRQALDKYNEVIKKYPSSDKIDNAAFKAGRIYEYFKDYPIALVYYQRAYQWDPQTPYPAKFKAAYILDDKLHRRAEALELYQQAVKELKSPDEHLIWKEYARKRIADMTASDRKSL